MLHSILMLAKLGEHSSLSLLAPEHLTKLHRPEQLVLPDDPSFLPEFALVPPELLADLDLPFDLGITRTGESQSFTPFGSQHSQSSHGDAIGGLVLPSSSPSMPGGEFRLEGDNGLGSIGGPSGMLGAGDMLEVLEPDFTFGEDGDIIDLTASNAVVRTPGAPGRNTMHSDAGASERVRREHEEGRRTDAQVSFTAVFHVFLYRDFTSSFHAIARFTSLGV